MRLFRADLHCHSTCSDGSVPAEGLVRLAKQIGLSGLSITDHDTIAAYDTVLPIAEEVGIRLLPGVEFSAIHRDHSVHILAYGFDLENKELRDFCESHRLRRAQRYEDICAKLDAHGLTLKDEPQMDHSALGRPHIATRLVQAGYARDVSDAFQQFIGDGKRCFVPSSTYSVEETLQIIRRAGGLAVIAHPMLIKRSAIVKDLLRMDFDGIEGHYARIPPEQERRWIQKGEDRNWLVTGGSDFHGDVKPHISLGCSWVGEDVFEKLWAHYKNG